MERTGSSNGVHPCFQLERVAVDNFRARGNVLDHDIHHHNNKPVVQANRNQLEDATEYQQQIDQQHRAPRRLEQRDRRNTNQRVESHGNQRNGVGPAGSADGSHAPVLKCHLCNKFGSRRQHGKGLPYVTICEVRQHASVHDGWIVAKGNAYNVTEYFDIHPGGRRSLLRKLGGIVDCTEDYDFHSKKGKAIWKSMQVGVIVSCDYFQQDNCVIL